MGEQECFDKLIEAQKATRAARSTLAKAVAHENEINGEFFRAHAPRLELQGAIVFRNDLAYIVTSSSVEEIRVRSL